MTGARRKRTLRGRYDRSKTPEERHAEQRTRLLDAARDVLADGGWSAATVDAVLERSQLSRATFYAHFRELDDALLAAYERASESARRIVEEELAQGADPLERARVGVTAFLRLVEQHPALARIMFDVGRGSPPRVVAMHEAARARFVALLVERGRANYEAGLVDRAPDEITAYAVVCAIQGVALRYLDQDRASEVMEAGPALLRLLVRALT